MAFMTEKELEEYKESLCKLDHSLDLIHLGNMIKKIAENPETTFSLRESPMYKHSPADICEMLEELGWYESDILIDRHWSDITFWNNKYNFELHLSFNGFEWTANLFRGEDL